MRIPRLLLCATALALSAGEPSAAPGDAIGSAVTVVNLVTAKLESDQRDLAVGDNVRQQELIEVADDGRGEIELRDKTKVALGPGSRLLLDKFVYDPDVSGGAIALDLIKGTFRFITGVAAKPAYVIRTPAASITVRGTIFDVYIKSPRETWLLLIEGAIRVCTQNGKCRLHDEPGKLIRITAEQVDKPVKWKSVPAKRKVVFDNAFPFVATPPAFDPAPPFTRDDIVLGTLPVRPFPVPPFPGRDGPTNTSPGDNGPTHTGPTDNGPTHTGPTDTGGKDIKGTGGKKVMTFPSDRQRVKRRRRVKTYDAELINKAIGAGIGIAIGLGKNKGGNDKGGKTYPRTDTGGKNYNRFNRFNR